MAPRAKPNPGAVAQPLGPVPQPRARGDWAARARTNVTDAQQYTRFVGIMKRVLLFAAGGLILAVVIYSVLPREQSEWTITTQEITKIKNDLAMVKPKLTGADSAGNPFVITADKAVQLGRNARRANLYNVEADMTLKDGGWMNASAAKGLLDANKRTIALSGAIAVFSDQGYELHTDLADVDLNKGLVRGDHMVSGQGPLGTLRADRFTIQRSNKQVQLIGNVHMTINVSGMKKS
ncbi:MAG: LPS export ABC transporter periplasmic protein LptC [Proteobacteria bacterium]|nr:LPS export ABC transporter periplasmic protein LptC [Pseudomonadota bacterium]